MNDRQRFELVMKVCNLLDDTDATPDDIREAVEDGIGESRKAGIASVRSGTPKTPKHQKS